MKFIKNNKYFILVLIITIFILNIKLPYYIETSGGLININDRYTIENQPKIKGSINMTYVAEYKANIGLYLYAKINKDYDIYKKEAIISSNETDEESNIRGKIMLKEANDNAITVAYEKANKTYKIKSQKIFIIYIDEDAKTNIKIGDEILEVDDIKVNSKEEIKGIINKHKSEDKIKFKVRTNKGKIIEKYGYLNEDKIVGLMMATNKEIETDPKLTIEYKSDEFGPSGGLMSTLSIYNKLVEEDITHGYIISGTGTMEEDGTVDEIAGIKYKLRGAVKNKAHVFFVPSKNYKEAIKYKKKNNYKIDIVKVKNIDDALKYLEKLKEE